MSISRHMKLRCLKAGKWSSQHRPPSCWCRPVFFWLNVLLVFSPAAARNKIYSSVDVAAVVRGVAELPCDLTTPDPNDQVRLVLWYRSDSASPIYSVDTRGADFSHATEQHWSGDEILGQRASFRADRHPAALVVTDIKQRDEGLYRCRVDFRLAQTRNAHINLTVVVPPRRPSISTKQGPLSTSTLPPFIEGQSLSLSCETTGGKPLPRLVWWRDGRIIDDTFTTSPGDNTVRNDLWIAALGRHDFNAILVCEASNSNLTQTVSSNVVVDMYLPPLDVQLVGIDQPLSAGKEAMVTCLVRGSRPPPVLIWFLGDDLIKEMTAVVTSSDGNETRGMLQFLPTANDGGKRLTCLAKNAKTGASAAASDADSAGANFKASRILVVHYRPRVQLSLGSSLQATNIKEGDDVYFDCRSSALPPVTRLEWFHNDKKLPHNVSAGIIITNQSLVLQRVGRHSAGRYRCIAWNREGETESDVFHLDVKYSPFCRPGQHRVYGVARHEEARIICDLDANPSAGLHFKWFFNSSAGFTELPATAWTFEGSRSVARYLPSSDLDFGSLLCSASNSIGQQSLPCVYHVIPADKPDPVANCSVSHLSSESLQITCHEGFSGGLPQNFLLEMFSTEDDTLRTNMTSLRPTFTIRGLRPDTHYIAYVSATNAKGNSEPLVVRIVTLRLPETQRNTGSEAIIKTHLQQPVQIGERPRPQPSASDMAISPLVAIITGAVSALFLLVALLVIALRLRCRTRRDSDTLSAGQRSRTATDVTKSASRDMGPSACSETQLLAKTEQRSSTPLFNVENDEGNPDLIPQQDDETLLPASSQLLQAGIVGSSGGGGGGVPMAALLSDLPPHFYTRQPGMMVDNSATLGRGKARWRAGEPMTDFTAQSLPHVASTLPRPPRPPWTTIAATEVTTTTTLYPPTTIVSKKESSV